MLAVADGVPVAAIALVLGAAVLAPGFLWDAGLGIAVVGLLIGLPHGAVDHLVPFRGRERGTPVRSYVVVLVGYVAAAATMFALLRITPEPALAVFLLLSIWHFGTGEVTYASLRHDAAGVSQRAGLPSLVRVVAWGGAVVLLPVVRWPDQAAPLLDGLAPGTSALLTPAVRGGVGVVVLAAVAATVLDLGLRAVRSGISVRPAGELALLTTTLLIAPPLVVFGIWFGLWHSLRHIVRLVADDPANAADLAAGHSGLAFRRFCRQAAAPTAAALAVLVALVVSSAGDTGFLTLDLQLVASLTVPHMAIVAWLDRQDTQRPGDRPAASARLLPKDRGRVSLLDEEAGA